MAIEYPATIPDLLTRFGLNPLSFSSYTDLLRELQALFNTAGTNPQGTGGTIDGRLDAIETALTSPAKAVITANSTTISNTTVETAFNNGSVTVLGNSSIVGRVFRITAGGTISTAGSSPGTLALRVRWGNLITDPLLLDLQVIGAGGLLAGLSQAGWWLSTLVTIRTAGASGTGIADGTANVGGQVYQDVITTTATINTTVDKSLTLSALWNTASSANQVILKTFLAEQVA